MFSIASLGLGLAAIIFAVVLIGLLSWGLIVAGGSVLRGIGAVLSRILEFVGGIFGDVARIVGAVAAILVFVPLVLLNVVIARWSAANHFSNAVAREVSILGRQSWSLVVRRPLRLLFLDGVLEGLEVRTVDAVRAAPGPDRPAKGIDFPGFEVVGSLPSGGSGAKLYIARPDEATRARLAGTPEEVVIKSFALAEGSSLPQIVRESRSLDSARRLGLVLAHQLDDRQFWYAMPYHPGDHLGIVVRNAHEADFEDGLQGDRLREMMGYAIDLVATLDRYHREGLWHKDVKPDNIIVHDGRAHLVDFGLVTSLRSAMTLTTHGTEYFRDPEMVRMAMRGVKVHEINGAKFDVYGAGAVLFFVLENTFPGHGGLSRFDRPAPDALRWIVKRAMAEYGQRYESAAEMLADLEVVAGSTDPWSVKPAALPSMSGVDRGEISAEVVEVENRRSPGGRPAPPPRSAAPIGIPASPSVAGGRPNVQVANWWTGAQAPQGTRSAADQVRSARDRARRRRSEVRAGRASGVLRTRMPFSLVTVVGSVIIVGICLGVYVVSQEIESVSAYGPDHVFNRTGGVDLWQKIEAVQQGGHSAEAMAMVAETMVNMPGTEIHWLDEDEMKALREGNDPNAVQDLIRPQGSGRFLIVDDRARYIDGPDPMAGTLARLERAGWTRDEDVDRVAAASIALQRCPILEGPWDRNSTFQCEAWTAFLEKWDVEAVLWVSNRAEGTAGVPRDRGRFLWNGRSKVFTGINVSRAVGEDLESLPRSSSGSLASATVTPMQLWEPAPTSIAA